MMQLTAQEIAASLLNRLYRVLGHKPQVEQVDFYDCSAEDPESNDVMANIWCCGDECASLCFERPPFFEPAEVEAAMMRGNGAVVLH